jgi:RNA polymerase sigma-70 factor (ECF subfamily)
METERGMLDGLRAGDSSAFEELVRREGPRMLSVTRRLLRNEEDARDALQDAFLSAFRSIDRFEGGSKVGTWLHRIAINAALMKLRTRRRKPERSIEEFLPTYLDDGHHVDRPQPWAESGEAGAIRAETRQLVRESIDRLPADYRNVLILRDIEELDTAETARLLGISAGAAKVRLHRARQALRTLLDPHFRESSQ